MMRTMLTAISLLVLWHAPAAAACMKPENVEIAEGRLTVGKFKDAADRPETAFILRLPVAACLDGADEDERVDSTRTIHVYASTPAIQKSLRRFVGKTVMVRGKPFAQHTAHHHASIVMEVIEIDTH